MNAVIIGERVEFGADSVEEKVPVAAWEVPTAHPSGEEDIAAKDFSGFVSDKAERSWAVAGDVGAIERDSFDEGGCVAGDYLSSGQCFVRPRHSEAFEEITVSSHRQGFLVK